MMKQLLVIVICLLSTKMLESARFRVDGSTPSLCIQEVIAGQLPESALDDSQEYALSFEGSQLGEITAQLQAPLPPGCCLQVEMQAPFKAVSKGFVDISSGQEEVIVSKIPCGNYSGLVIKYRFISDLTSLTMPPSLFAVQFKFDDNLG